MSCPRAFLCLVALTFMACGDDAGDGNLESDGGMDGSTGGTSGTGPGPSRPTPGRSDSSVPMDPLDASMSPTMPGTQLEGRSCRSVTDCAEDLTCVQSERHAFCARGCSSDADCGLESCISLTGNPADRHCINWEREPYAACGEAYTALCADRVCVLDPEFAVGTCFDICPLDGDADGGVPAGDPNTDAQLTECADDQVCADVLGAPDRGVCGSFVARGEECGPGRFCGEDDICSIEDPNDAEEIPLCRQNCTDGQACEGDTTCTDFRGQFAFCL